MTSRSNTNTQDIWYVQISPVFQETGEIKPIGDPVNIAKTPRGGFEIAYMRNLYDILDRIGGKKYAVFKYIIKHKDGMNCLNITNSELAEKCHVSRNTVIDTIKILTEAGVLVRYGTVIRLSARLFVKGSAQKEAYIMRKFAEECELASSDITNGSGKEDS